MTEQRPLLEVTDLVKHYPVRGGVLRRQVDVGHHRRAHVVCSQNSGCSFISTTLRYFDSVWSGIRPSA